MRFGWVNYRRNLSLQKPITTIYVADVKETTDGKKAVWKISYLAAQVCYEGQGCVKSHQKLRCCASYKVTWSRVIRTIQVIKWASKVVFHLCLAISLIGSVPYFFSPLNWVLLSSIHYHYPTLLAWACYLLGHKSQEDTDKTQDPGKMHGGPKQFVVTQKHK